MFLLSVAPQILQFSFGEEPSNSGDLVSVTCSAHKGDTPIELEWAFNGKPIKSRHGTDVVIGSTNKKNSVLTIDSVSAIYAGEYGCTASNKAGSITKSAILEINGTL